MRRRDFFKYGLGTGMAAMLGINTKGVVEARRIEEQALQYVEDREMLMNHTWSYNYEEFGKPPLCILNGKEVYPWSWVFTFARSKVDGEIQFSDFSSGKHIELDLDLSKINVVFCNVAEGWIAYYHMNEKVTFSKSDLMLALVDKMYEYGNSEVFKVKEIQDLIVDILDQEGNVITTLRSN